MLRTLTVHCFFSVKGGVGKSALAVALAHLLPDPDRCVVLDLDLTGTTLAHGLRLRAPRVSLKPDGTMDLDALPTGEFLSVKESRALRDARKRAVRGDPALPPPFFNDALSYRGESDERDCQLAALLWRHEQSESVRYLPSSSIDRHILNALNWLYQKEDEAGWMRRVAWLFYSFCEQLPELEHLVLDLPPGLFGFTPELLSLLNYINTSRAATSISDGYPDFHALARWDTRPYLVTSQDRQDLFLAMETFAELFTGFPFLVPLVNRLTDPIEEIRAAVRDRFDGLDLGHHLVSVGEHRSSLGRLFVDGDPGVIERERQKLRQELGPIFGLDGET